MQSGRRPGWKSLGVIVGVLFVGGAILTVHLRGVIDQRWADMGVRLEDLRTQSVARFVPKPLLQGEPLPGEAWDYYLQSIKSETEIPDLMSRVIYCPAPGPAPSGTENIPKKELSIPEVVAAHERELQAFHEGAKRVSRNRPSSKDLQINFARATQPPVNTAKLALCRAKLLFENGSITQALQETLDVGQFARDLGDNAESGSASASAEAFREFFLQLHNFLISGKLSENECAELGRALKILDDSFPTDEDIVLRALVREGDKLRSEIPIQVMDQDKGMMRPLSLYESRYFLFSDRLVAADAFEFLSRWNKRFQGLDTWPAIRVSQEVAVLYSEEKESKNPLMEDYSHYSAVPERMRPPRAQLRILRVASQYLAGGVLEDLPDPFGGSLRHSVESGMLKIWSRGPRGEEKSDEGSWDVFWHVGWNGVIVLKIVLPPGK